MRRNTIDITRAIPYIRRVMLDPFKMIMENVKGVTVDIVIS